MARREMPYTIPEIVREAIEIDGDRAAGLAFFLQANTGSILRKWRGRLTAQEQRLLFGRYLGRGQIIIDGGQETVAMVVSIAFGLDWETLFRADWRDLAISVEMAA